MIELLRAYTNELDLVYDQIEILWAEADKHSDKDYYLSDEFNGQIKKLYNRKAALKALINDLNKEKTFDFEI